MNKVFAGLFSIMVALSTSTVLAADQVNLQPVKIPSVSVGSLQVKNIALRIVCERETTVWEQMNNGLDAWATCNDLSISPSPEQNSYWAYLVKANSDGSFDLPPIHISYNKKIFKESVSCVLIYPFEYATVNGLEYPKKIETVENVVFCSKSPTPDFMSPSWRDLQAYRTSVYESVLSHPLNLTPKN